MSHTAGAGNAAIGHAYFLMPMMPLKRKARVCFIGSRWSDFWPSLRRTVRRRGTHFHLYITKAMMSVDKTLVTDANLAGDYVLTGGELVAMTMIDATVRRLQRCWRRKPSHTDDKASRLASWVLSTLGPMNIGDGLEVPASGHHEHPQMASLWKSERPIYIDLICWNTMKWRLKKKRC